MTKNTLITSGIGLALIAPMKAAKLLADAGMLRHQVSCRALRDYV